MPSITRSCAELACAVAVCFAVAHGAFGVVVSDDPDLHEVEPPSDYDMVAHLYWQGDPGSSAVLIDPWHFVTARHALNPGQPSDYTFILDTPAGPETFGVGARYPHPTIDIAVGRLDRSTGLPGYALYRQTFEVGKAARIAGDGVSGTGYTGKDPNTYPRGTMRFGENRVDQIYDGGVADYLLFDFDHPTKPGPTGPGSLGASREALISDGDSGGAALLSISGTLYLAGIHSSVFDYNNNGVQSDFGDLALALRISPLADWIDDQLVYKTLDLSIVNEPWGTVSISPMPDDANAPSFPVGVEVTLTAEPIEGKEFAGWQIFDPNHPGDSNHARQDTNNPLTITMNDGVEIQAVFQCGDEAAVLLPVLLIALSVMKLRRLG